jgi:hypothetical protein
MTYPEGAIESVFDFKKAAVPGAVFYVIFNDKTNDKFKWLINENFELVEDHASHRWRFNVDSFRLGSDEGCRNNNFWSPYGNLHFPRGAKIRGYLFGNYWHAYAYGLKCKEPA